MCYCYVLHPILWCTVYTECHIAPKCPAPKRRCAKMSCAKTVAPKRQRQTVTYRSIHHSLNLTLFLFSSNCACSVLCGIRSIVILSTHPSHRSLRWTTLSSRVVWLPKPCLTSLFLILCSLVTRAILRSQLISAARILFSSSFRIVQHSDPYKKSVIASSRIF